MSIVWVVGPPASGPVVSSKSLMTAAALRAYPTLFRVGVSEAVAYRTEFLIWMLTTTLPLALGKLQAMGEIRRVPVNGRLDQQRYKYSAWRPNPLRGFHIAPEEIADFATGRGGEIAVERDCGEPATAASDRTGHGARPAEWRAHPRAQVFERNAGGQADCYGRPGMCDLLQQFAD